MTRSTITESPYGRTWWWWRRKPLVSLDPWRIRLADTPVDRRVVEAYKRDPDRGSIDGNDPCVVRRPDLGLHALEGKHRIIAARETGRQIEARLAEDNNTEPPTWWT